MARLGFGPKTDDRGRFYAPGLPPGTYTVRTSLPQAAMLLSSITGRQSVDVKTTQGGALRVFYGDVYRLKDAKLIDLHEGEDRTGVDLDIPTSGMYTVRGTVTCRQEVPGVATGTVRLLDPDGNGVLRETLVDAGGAFTFENVTKGNYLIQIEGQDGSRARQPGPHYDPMTVPLTVEHDMSGLDYTLRLSKPAP